MLMLILKENMFETRDLERIYRGSFVRDIIDVDVFETKTLCRRNFLSPWIQIRLVIPVDVHKIKKPFFSSLNGFHCKLSTVETNSFFRSHPAFGSCVKFLNWKSFFFAQNFFDTPK